jgi:hypothetical protein
LVDDISPVGDAQRFPHAVIGNQQAQAYPLKGEDDSLQFLDGQWIDSGEGFVEQDETGVGDEGPGNFQPPSFPPRQLESLGFGQLLQPEIL